ncbi:MAG TPA: hypothetical protein VFQ53_32370 [Kofleriaceae bacterium]|nr:hypothetical protein [Kofleriaceae bacterium]
MSYDQTFRGVFEYPDAHHLEAGIDAFVARLGDTVVDLSDLEIDGLTIAIEQSCSAPAGMYEETQIALRELGHYAASGWIDTTFVLDGTSHDHVGSGRPASDRAAASAVGGVLRGEAR